jgi:hypothetical protein
MIRATTKMGAGGSVSLDERNTINAASHAPIMKLASLRYRLVYFLAKPRRSLQARTVSLSSIKPAFGLWIFAWLGGILGRAKNRDKNGRQ